MSTVLFGSLELDGVDVSDDVVTAQLTLERTSVEVPPSLGRRVAYAKAGGESWNLEITYRQSEIPQTVAEIIKAAAQTSDALVDFKLTLGEDEDTDNWYGTVTVFGFGAGGTADSLLEDTQTLRLVDRPVRTSGEGS